MRLGNWILALLLLLTTAASAVERPASKGTAPLASSVTTVRKEGGKFAGQAYFDALPADQQEKLKKEGHVLLGEEKGTAGSYGGYIRAVAIFKQSKKRTYELITDPSKQVLYLPRLVSSASAVKTPTSDLVEFGLKVVFSTYHTRVQHWFYPEQSRIEWFLDPTFKNDIKSQEGYWQLFELDDNTTIGEFGTHVETGLAVPKFLQNIFAKSDIPKAMMALRKYVDSNGTYRRED